MSRDAVVDLSLACTLAVACTPGCGGRASAVTEDAGSLPPAPSAIGSALEGAAESRALSGPPSHARSADAGIAFAIGGPLNPVPPDAVIGGVAPCPGSRSPTVIASRQSGPEGVAVDANNVYWTTDALQVLECAKNGCNNSPTVLISSGPSTFQPRAIAVDATDVYWSFGGQIERCSTAGCNDTPTILVPSQSAVFSIVVDAKYVYWTTYPESPGSVMRCAKTGCPDGPEVLASGQPGPAYLAIDAANAYWTNYFGSGSSGSGSGFAVMKCTLGGCNDNPTVLASAQNGPWPIAVDATNVYWAGNQTDVLACAVGGCNDQPTLLSRVSGGLVQVEVIAVGDTAVYWATTPTGDLMKCAKSGCGGRPTVIASGQRFPFGIAVDAKKVYWTSNGNGTVMTACQ